MPAKRLPWFKLESGVTSHAKVAVLSDAQFRVWVELLDAASRQPVRGRFTSFEEAAAVTRRSVKAIRSLCPSLIDNHGEYIEMHDWPDWQNRYPSDLERSANDPPTPDDNSPDDSVNAPRTLRDDSDKKKRESSTPNGVVARPENHEAETEPEKPGSRVTVVDAAFTEALVEEFGPLLGAEIVRDKIELALSWKGRSKYRDQRRWLRNWIRGDAEKAARFAPGRPSLAVVSKPHRPTPEFRWVEPA